MQGNHKVILVDAVSTNQQPGILVRLGIDDIKAEANNKSSQVSTHGIGLADTLALGRSLQRLPRQMLLLGLETGGDVEWKYSQAEFDHLVNAVRSESLYKSKNKQ